MRSSRSVSCLIVLSCVLVISHVSHRKANAQAIGLELHNTMMSASGGMAGTSFARPQDVVSTINGNPATMTQMRGTQVNFSGGWVEPSHVVSHGGSVPGLGAFTGGSGWPGSMIGNIGLTQELTTLGLPITTGVALVTTAGAGAEFRDQRASNGASIGLTNLHFKSGASLLLTENLSIGGTIGVGNATLEAPFVGSGAMTSAFGFRGSVGLYYTGPRDTTLGIYYESKSSYKFHRAIQPLGIGPFRDIYVDLPRNIGVGIANSSLLNGNLLLAFDVLYKNHSDADFLRAIYEDQWAASCGAQLTRGKIKYRVGYAYVENAMVDVVPPGAGGITPGANAIQFIEALAPAISPHRFTMGLERTDLLPGMDFNFFAGTMLEASDTFGDTSASISTYYLGGGLTWRFRRGSGYDAAPDEF